MVRKILFDINKQSPDLRRLKLRMYCTCTYVVHLHLLRHPILFEVFNAILHMHGCFFFLFFFDGSHWSLYEFRVVCILQKCYEKKCYWKPNWL